MTLATVARAALCASLVVVGCDDFDPDGSKHERRVQEEYDRKRWEGPCHDEASLLATTSGSPSYKQCPNRLHRMRVQVATHPSNEEAAALVFCECVRQRQDGGVR